MWGARPHWISISFPFLEKLSIDSSFFKILIFSKTRIFKFECYCALQAEKSRDNILPRIMARSDDYDALFQVRSLDLCSLQ